MNLGNGLTLQEYATLIEDSGSSLETHNLALAEADRTRIEFAQTEASVSALSSRILSAVAAVYGKDSKEYEMAGGKPPSSYKRTRKPSTVSETGASQTMAVPANGAAPTSSNGAASNGAQVGV